ncbi:MAG: hypothetical protein B0W54_17525 [Cellvibrio sp. 79]|nr:MAG: hypothetical protein B0W54_17525 [Cellvibrio sp. 79]
MGINNSIGGTIDNVTWEQIDEKLKLIIKESGSLGLDILKEIDEGPCRLEIITEKGAFLLLLVDEDGNGNFVREYFNPNTDDTKIFIRGNQYSGRTISYDEDFVFSVFKEFFTTGNVSEEILSR